MKKHNFIRDDVNIEFAIPDRLKEVFAEAEELDAKKDIEFICVADLIDNMCKGYYSQGALTKKQWELITAKYSTNVLI